MKLNWLGNATFRIHIGGAIVVVGVDDAPQGIDRVELLGGADLAIRLNEDRPVAGAQWRPRAPLRLLDEDSKGRPPELWSLGADSLLIDPDGEAPLALLGGRVPELGRWVEKSVLVVFGGEEPLASRSERIMDMAPPRLLALAGSEADVDASFAVLRDRLDGTGLVALEPGMAVEA